MSFDEATPRAVGRGARRVREPSCTRMHFGAHVRACCLLACPELLLCADCEVEKFGVCFSHVQIVAMARAPSWAVAARVCAWAGERARARASKAAQCAGQCD